jgi:hypothetical protein
MSGEGDSVADCSFPLFTLSGTEKINPSVQFSLPKSSVQQLDTFG